jgi:hypothetical protein
MSFVPSEISLSQWLSSLVTSNLLVSLAFALRRFRKWHGCDSTQPRAPLSNLTPTHSSACEQSSFPRTPRPVNTKHKQDYCDTSKVARFDEIRSMCAFGSLELCHDSCPPLHTVSSFGQPSSQVYTILANEEMMIQQVFDSVVH